MSEKICIRTAEELARQLRLEALAERPAFSAALHDRLCAAISADRSIRARPGRVWCSRARGWAALATVAAGLAACLVVARNVSLQTLDDPARAVRESQGDDPAAFSADLVGLAEPWSTDLPALVDGTLLSEQWAYLDHDAQLAMELLADHLSLDFSEQ